MIKSMKDLETTDLSALPKTQPPKKGSKFDKGKIRLSLFPLNTLRSILAVLEFGASKYSENNWMKVRGGEERYFDAAIRHLISWKEGEWLDKESKLPHLAHASCCCIFLLWFGLKNLKPKPKRRVRR